MKSNRKEHETLDKTLKTSYLFSLISVNIHGLIKAPLKKQ